MEDKHLDFLFHPRSVALVGVTTSNPEHWTRTFLDGFVKFQFGGPLYLVNPKGGEIDGIKVYPGLRDIKDSIDYVVGLVPATAGPSLVEECAGKGVKAVQFCTAGFSETGNGQGARLEAEVLEAARKTGIRVIGPNCMGVYCPEAKVSYSPMFPKEAGPVGLISQSGGNAIYLIRQAGLRGVRFSKTVSFGNACDLNESDFLEYMADDPETKVIATYLEGVRDGERFRRALEKATARKPVILIKGGMTEAGARACAGHTSALAGSNATWDALCRQYGVLRVDSLDEMVDMLVAFLYLPVPRGRNAVLFGAGGGASVLITDEFERRGIRIPPFPNELESKVLEYTSAAGNILRNPVDYSQTMLDTSSLFKTLRLISEWDGMDFMVSFVRTGQQPKAEMSTRYMTDNGGGPVSVVKAISKPVAMVVEPSIIPREAEGLFTLIQRCVAERVPVYFSFASAASAISQYMSYAEKYPDRMKTYGKALHGW